MIQFIVGCVVGFYIGAYGVGGSIDKVNAGVDVVQEVVSNAAKK
jgi:hypothetical protein